MFSFLKLVCLWIKLGLSLTNFYVSNTTLQIPEQDFGSGISLNNGYMYLIGGSSGVSIDTRPPPRRIKLIDNIQYKNGINKLNLIDNIWQGISNSWPSSNIMNPKTPRDIRISSQSYTQRNNLIYLLSTDGVPEYDFASNLLIYDMNINDYKDDSTYNYKLPYPTSGYMCITHTQFNLYVFGGIVNSLGSHSKIQIYSFDNDTWSFGSNIKAGNDIIGIDSVGCSPNVNETYIYLFGGYILNKDGFYDRTDIISKYDILNDECMILNEKLHEPELELRSILNKYHDYIYIFSDLPYVQIFNNYNERLLNKNISPILPVHPVTGVSICILNDIIFVLGGYNKENNTAQNTIQYSFFDVDYKDQVLLHSCTFLSDYNIIINIDIDVDLERVYIDATVPNNTNVTIIFNQSYGIFMGETNNSLYNIKEYYLNSSAFEDELPTSIVKTQEISTINDGELVAFKFWRPINGITNDHYSFPTNKSNIDVEYIVSNQVHRNHMEFDYITRECQSVMNIETTTPAPTDSPTNHKTEPESVLLTCDTETKIYNPNITYRFVIPTTIVEISFELCDSNTNNDIHTQIINSNDIISEQSGCHVKCNTNSDNFATLYHGINRINITNAERISMKCHHELPSTTKLISCGDTIHDYKTYSYNYTFNILPNITKIEFAAQSLCESIHIYDNDNQISSNQCGQLILQTDDIMRNESISNNYTLSIKEYHNIKEHKQKLLMICQYKAYVHFQIPIKKIIIMLSSFTILFILLTNITCLYYLREKQRNIQKRPNNKRKKTKYAEVPNRLHAIDEYSGYSYNKKNMTYNDKPITNKPKPLMGVPSHSIDVE